MGQEGDVGLQARPPRRRHGLTPGVTYHAATKPVCEITRDLPLCAVAFHVFRAALNGVLWSWP